MSKLIIINEETNRVSAIELDGKKKVYLTVRNGLTDDEHMAIGAGTSHQTDKNVKVSSAADTRSKTSSDKTMLALIKRALKRNDGSGRLLIMTTKGNKAKSAAKYYAMAIEKYPATAISNDILSIRVR